MARELYIVPEWRPAQTPMENICEELLLLAEASCCDVYIHHSVRTLSSTPGSLCKPFIKQCPRNHSFWWNQQLKTRVVF